VIAVAQAPDGAVIGVIVNRPLAQSLAELLPDQPSLARFTEPLRMGGPVERNGLFALYQAPAPVGESLTVGGDVHLALLPPDVERLIDAPPRRLRFFAGYSGWAPDRPWRLVGPRPRCGPRVPRRHARTLGRAAQPPVPDPRAADAVAVGAAGQAGTGSASAIASNRISPPFHSTRMVSLGWKRPSRICFASGFSI
jgi:Uncharacterized ACR, COG1678